MKSAVLLVVAAFCLLTNINSAVAQQETIVGTWAAVDPATGREEQLIITATHLQFDPDQPPLPYKASQTGNLFVIKVGDGNIPPLRINFLGDEKATLTVPGSEPIAITRVVAAPSAASPPAQTAATPPAQQNAMDEVLAAFVPFGVQTKFEPLNQSLEQLLSEGWSLDQAGGAGGGYTLLLSKGKTRALCMLIPQSLGQSTTALSDCRRLN